MKLKLEKLIMLESDDKGTLHSCNSWIVGGRTKCITTRHYFLKKIKEIQMGFYLRRTFLTLSLVNTQDIDVLTKSAKLKNMGECF